MLTVIRTLLFPVVKKHAMKRCKTLFCIILVNLVVLCAGIAIIELLFGAWLKPQKLNRLNVIVHQSVEYDVSKLYDTASAIIKYTRDKYGLRGTYGDDPSRIDLLTVGGSTTDQQYVSDGSTWQDVLQNQFASIGTPVGVANAGVNGQSTFGHINDFEYWFPYIPHLRPRYVLFYVGLNDFYIDEGFSYDALIYADRYPLLATLRENSALWHLQRAIRGTYKAMIVLKIHHKKVDFTKVRWTSTPFQNDYGFMSSRLHAYARRLNILIEKTRAFGSEPIFVTQPSRQFRLTKEGIQGRADVTIYDGRKINGVDYYHMIREFDRVMEVVCREMHVLFVDLAAELEWADNEFYDFTHMTPRGARKVGLYLFDKLRGIPKLAEPAAAPRQ